MSEFADLDVAGATGRLALRGEIDLMAVAEVQVALAEAREQRVTTLEVDLGLVDFIDSSGLGILAAAAAEFDHLRVVAAPISVVRTLEMTGLGDLVALRDPGDA